MYRLQVCGGPATVAVPPAVHAALVDREWIEDIGDMVRVTDSGAVVSDLNGPEWGIEPLYVE